MTKGRPTARVTIRSVVIRDTPPPMPEPFSTESAAELSAYRAVLETSLGNITVEFMPDKAPNHVRNFLRLAQSGFYDGMAFHRVVKGFVAQTGYIPSRAEPLSEAQERFVHTLQPEFNDTKHVKGHRLDGARRRSRQRRHVVLHFAWGELRRSTASTRPSGASLTACRSSTPLKMCRSTAKRPAIASK